MHQSLDETTSFPAEDDGLQARVLRTMAIAVGVAVMTSLMLAPWRVSSGLLLGGLLSLLNYYWMSKSISAGFRVLVAQERPRISLLQYILRYFVIGIIVLIAYKLKLVSLPATIVGLCSFVVALICEAARELYFAIFHREEIS